MVNELIVQNQKVLDSNKYMGIEMYNGRTNQDEKMDRLIMFIITYMTKMN